MAISINQGSSTDVELIPKPTTDIVSTVMALYNSFLNTVLINRNNALITNSSTKKYSIPITLNVGSSKLTHTKR